MSGYRIADWRTPVCMAVRDALKKMACGEIVEASSRAIAKEAGVSHWSVQSVLATLEGRGLVETIELGRNQFNAGRYRLL